MDQLSQIPSIGPKTISKLNKLNIHTPTDLLYHFPSRYIDFSHITNISEVSENENVTITGKLIKFQNIFTRFGKNIQKAIVIDKTGQINLLWFNQPYLSKNFKIGDTYSFAGTVSLFQKQKTIIGPVYGQYNTGKIISIYPETAGLTSNWFRKTLPILINQNLSQIKDTLPLKILSKYSLLNLNSSLKNIHLPQNFNLLNQARNRLAVEEIIKIQIKSFLAKQQWLSQTSKFKLKITPKYQQKIDELINNLPYKLTFSQQKVLSEVINDLTDSKKITNRLIQGDVGSGKTIVALIACFLNHLNNYSSLLIAPTEILANQHLKTFQEILKPFNVPIFLLTGSQKITKKIPTNSIIISTHAAIYQKDKLDNIALLIFDEQHKFGVKQRAFLSSQINLPHCLTMTATPIPRTVSLTILGNLELSTIDTLPQKRLPIKTFLTPSNKIKDCYHWIESEILKTHCQAFIVCPFIEESESIQSVKSAIKEFEYLSKEVFPKLKLGLIHGKTKSVDREKILQHFKENKINILVTTPIIEVGIDFPNSTIMVIQSADRFGLAQLHQIRGRVGRGQLQSYCYLFSESQNDKAINRLRFLAQNSNGIKIAEYDLKNRGPGEAFSIIQHGFPSFRLASLSDLDLITLGQKIVSDLQKIPKFDFNQILAESLPEQNIINN